MSLAQFGNIFGIGDRLSSLNSGTHSEQKLTMHTIRLDLKQGSASVDSAPIVVDEKGVLIESIAKICSPPTQTDEGRRQYRLLRKASICGKSADGVIEVEEGRVCAITFLFDLIEFFESSVLESKLLKACEKSLNVHFVSNHPSTASLGSCEWGQVIFFYDAKQGDLSLEITFQRSSNESNLKA
jgi:hypothetical protein